MIDGKKAGSRVKVRVGARFDTKSGPRKPGVVEPGLLEVSLLCAMALLGAKNLSDSLGAMELRGGFF